MAATGFTPIQLYRTTTPSAAPTAGNLADGELAINVTDGKLFYKDNANAVQVIAWKNVPVNTLSGTVAVNQGGTGQTTYTNGQLLIGNTTGNTLTKATLTAGSGVSITNGAGSITISATGSGGDVVGPASSTDNAVVRFDGTTGKLVQNSGVLIEDDGTTVISVNSATDALRITQTGAGNALVVEDEANPDSTPTVINADGRLILGTTSANPVIVNSKIQVSGTAGDAFVQAVRFNSAASGNDCAYILGRSYGTSFSSRSAVVAESALGALLFVGDDGTNWVQGAKIQAFVDGTPGTNDMPGRLVFSTTADGASTPTERMRITNNGNIGVGGTPAAGRNFALSSNITGSTTSRGYTAIGIIQSDVTTTASYFATSAITVDAAFTLTNLIHYQAIQSTISGGSRTAPTGQYGFYVDSTLTGATNNFGFYSNIASGTGRWNFYANGTAANYFAGKVGVGTLPFSDTSGISIGSSITGGTVQSAINIYTTVQSDVTNIARGCFSQLGTAVASFTLSNLQHFVAEQLTLGVGSAVTNQYGFVANSTLTGATNNYGFFSNIASGTGRWNFYANGTADNYFGGRIGIGTTNLTTNNINMNLAMTGGTTVVAVLNQGTVQSDATSNARYFQSFAKTAAASFTLTDLTHYYATQSTIGAGSTVTNQYGYHAESTLTGATNNYGFYSNIASGTGRWNFFANGTAANYFGGQVQLNQDYIEKRFTANSGTSITLDLANGTMQDITLTGSPTITMPTAVAGKSFILLLRSGAGSYAVTWSTVKWPGGTAPTVTTTASRLDIYSFFSDGTNWYGVTVNQNYTP